MDDTGGFNRIEEMQLAAMDMDDYDSEGENEDHSPEREDPDMDGVKPSGELQKLLAQQKQIVGK